METAQKISDEPGALYAQSAVLMDADSGRVLFGKNEEKIRPMASTTKIMTCILTLEKMEKNQVADVSEKAAGQPKVRLGVKKGERYYIEELLYSLMLESHNDSAVVIAESVGGSVEGFAGMMNEKAKKIGCENTHFVTPNGLDGFDSGGVHSTTASDLARIMKYCITESPKKEEFLKITRTKSKTVEDVEKKRRFSCNNHNSFLTMMDGALTGKTGFTADAGYCYVGALKRDERTFIVSLLACGWPNNKSYKWKDTKKLMQYGLENYEYRTVWEELPEKLRHPVRICVKRGVDEKNPYLFSAEIPVDMDENAKKEAQSFRMLLRSDEKISGERQMKSFLEAPVQKGQKTGEFIYRLNGEEVKRYEIITLKSMEKRGFVWSVGEIAERLFL